MKPPVIFCCLFLALATLSNLCAQEIHQVMASDYCSFLNQAAASDTNHLYDKKMGSDSVAACIKRLGEPGYFHYEVIEGRENVLITFIDEQKGAAYATWSGKEIKVLSSISSNTAGIEVVSLSSSTLSLAGTATSTGNFSSCLDEASIVAGVFAIAACHELMMQPGAEANEPTEGDTSRTREATSPNLETFRTAHQAYPTATRFVVVADGTVIPREADPNTAGRNRSENMATRQALKAALTREHSPEIAEKLLPQNRDIINNSSDLTGTRLQEIFAAVDAEVLTLKKFRDILDRSDYTPEQRLIIRGKGARIRICFKKEPEGLNEKRRDNERIQEALRVALKNAGFSSTSIAGWFSKELDPTMINRLQGVKASLEGGRLQKILQRARDEITLQPIYEDAAEDAAIVKPPSRKKNIVTSVRDISGNVIETIGFSKERARDIAEFFIPKTATEILDDAQRVSWERAQIERLIRDVINKGREPGDFENDYQPAEALYTQAQEAWKKYNETVLRISINKKVLEWLRDLLITEQKRLAEAAKKTKTDLLLELSYQTLEKGSSKLEKLSIATGDSIQQDVDQFTSDLFGDDVSHLMGSLQGIAGIKIPDIDAKGVIGFCYSLFKWGVEKNKQVAKDAIKDQLKKVLKELEQDKKNIAQLQQVALDLAEPAKYEDEAARLKNSSDTTAVAKLMDTPDSDNTIEWRKWTQQLMHLGHQQLRHLSEQQQEAWSQKITEQALKCDFSLLASTIWLQRLSNSKALVKTIEENGGDQVEKDQSALKEAETAALSSTAEAKEAQEAFQQATERYFQLEKNLNNVKESYNQLILTPSSEQASIREETIRRQQEEMGSLTVELESVKTDWKNKEQEALDTEKNAAIAQEQARECSRIYFNTKERYKRAVARAKTNAAADSQIWDNYVRSEISIIKAGVAEIKELEASPCGDSRSDKKERANSVLNLIRIKMWPTFSKAMKIFIKNPSQETLAFAQKAATAYGSNMALVVGRASNVKEASELSETTEIIADANKKVAGNSRSYIFTTLNQDHLCWVAIASEEGALFAKMVEKLKKEEGEKASKKAEEIEPEWMRDAEIEKERVAYQLFQNASEIKTEEAWSNAKKAAEGVVTYYEAAMQQSNISEGVSFQEMVDEKNYWLQKMGVAEIKALATQALRLRERFTREDIIKMITLIRKNIWPEFERALNAFIQDSRKARISNKFYRAAYAYAYAYASLYAYTSSPASAAAYAYTSASASASASTFAYANVSSFSLPAAYVYAYAYASASTFVISAASAAEAADIAKAATTIAVSTKNMVNVWREEQYEAKFPGTQENLEGAVAIMNKVATFAEAVAALREGPEAVERFKMGQEDKAASEIRTKEVEAKAAEEARMKAVEEARAKPQQKASQKAQEENCVMS